MIPVTNDKINRQINLVCIFLPFSLNTSTDIKGLSRLLYIGIQEIGPYYSEYRLMSQVIMCIFYEKSILILSSYANNN